MTMGRQKENKTNIMKFVGEKTMRLVSDAEMMEGKKSEYMLVRAVENGYDNGEETSQFWSIFWYSARAEKLVEHLEKGKIVTVYGEFKGELGEYKGETQLNTTVSAFDIRFAPTPAREDSGDDDEKPKKKSAPAKKKPSRDEDEGDDEGDGDDGDI